MKDKLYDIHNEIRTPSGNEYDPAIASSIRRRYGFTIQGNQLTVTAQYTVDGMRYKVNSIFDLLNTPSSDEGLKRLMVDEANKAS
ncbi:MAG: hypothetical protein IJE01_03665 [Clostridia bacterium]|jgi:hypothetical protein|nr:hypothetical protein [Clostridia bacterium]MBQ5318115.1 hypothetical protein [Oscillospiraceae bacterium]